MNQLKSVMDAVRSGLQRALRTLRAQPFGIIAAVCALAAAVIVLLLPGHFSAVINSLSLAAAKRLAGTGTAKLAPITADARTCLLLAICAMALYLGAVHCALRCARSLRSRLRDAVQAKRAQHKAAGHTPPPGWDKDVARDIDHISAMVAALPEWLMLVAGIVFSVMLLVRGPGAAAIWIPITAVVACITRDMLRQRHMQSALQTCAVSAIWCTGTLMMILRAVQPSEPGIALGTLCLLLIGMALIVPGALQLPYRNLHPAWEAFRRVRGFLK